jgi:phage-related protein
MGYDVEVTTEDVNGNEGKYEKHIDGLLEGLFKFILEFIAAVIKFILELISLFIEWIWNAITGMMEVVIKPITDAISGYVRGVANTLGNAFNEYDETGTLKSSTADNIENAIFPSFIHVVAVLISIISAVMSLISPFLSLVSGLLSSAASFVKSIIISAFGRNVGGDDDEIEQISSPQGMVKYIANQLGVDYTKPKGKGVCSEISKIISFASFIVSLLPFIFKGKSDKSSGGKLLDTIAGPAISLILSIIGCIISFGNSRLKDFNEKFLATGFGIIISFSGFGMGISKMVGSGGFNRMLCVSSTAVGLIGVFSGMGSLLELI